MIVHTYTNTRLNVRKCMLQALEKQLDAEMAEKPHGALFEVCIAP